MKVEALVFDLYGTLLDVRSLSRRISWWATSKNSRIA